MGKKKNNKQSSKWEDSDEFDVPDPIQESQDNTEKPMFNQDENGEDLGGLMSLLPASKRGKKGKKSKKSAFDDDEDAAEILAKLDAAEAVKDDYDPSSPGIAKKSNNKKKNAGFSAFASLMNDDDSLEKSDQESDKEPVVIPKSVESVQPKKKGKKSEQDDELDALMAEIESPAASPKPKGKKGKKGKKGASFDDEMDLLAQEIESGVTVTETPTAKTLVPEDEPETGEIRIKSKKEKERERKERLKQAKKEQAAKVAKKTETPVEPTKELTPEPTSTQQELPEEDENDNDDSKDKKKKKKKKGAKEEVPKRKGAPVAALREAMLARKAAEEEARRIAEEEAKRLEEEARLKAEEEKRIQEAKERKKEKERLKKLELKKQGKYLTPAQKAAQAQARAKMEALLASSNVRVEALENKADAPRKRVVYSNRKKKTPNNQPKTDENKTVESPALSSGATTPAPQETIESWEVVSNADKDEADTKEAWDQESEKEEVKETWEQESEEEPVKDSWDQDSDGAKENWDDDSEDEKPKKAIAETKNAPVTKTETKKPVQTPAPAEESDSEEDSSDEEDEADTSDDDSDDSEEDSSDEDISVAQKMALQRKQEAAARRQERVAAAMAARSKDDLRSPICVILGHVDTGKTKLLDKIRQTNVQEGEAGGITQQIGATFFPMEAIIEKTAMIHKGQDPGYKVPGLLIIDTPGHESFTNLRSRGSSLCNIAILVVDIVHGLEQQTIESIGLLRQRKTPFIVALNKIDRMFGWKANENYPTRETLALQPAHAVKEFKQRTEQIIVQFAEQGLNACLYWENTNMSKYVSLVPTSAITGEGVPDLLHLLVDLTQSRMTERLMYLSELECTVLEVKVIEGLGTTIDVILSNGVLNEGDRICVCGLNGPIVTNVRALLTPQPMRELRVKSAYVHHKQVKAALGVKISAPDLEKAIAGSRLMVIGPDDDEEEIMEEVMGDLTSLLSSIDKSGKGVCVQASTLGSLEALLSFLESSKIPVSGINIGPVHKKDIIRTSVMLERAREYALLLAFDVPVDKDAAELAESMGVKIFTANIIYHLFDQFTAHMKALEEQRKRDNAPAAVFPCTLSIVPGCVFNKKSPIIVGVDVTEGTLRIGTPICVVDPDSGNVISLGKVTGLEVNHKAKTEVKRGDPSVAVRIEVPSYDTPKAYGRHFTEQSELYSQISRTSIDICKSTFRAEMTKEDWALIIKLKKILKID